jgi:hypothetical protein
MGSIEFSMRCRRMVPAIAAVLTLSACTGGMGAAVQSMRELLPSAGSTEAPKLDPKLEYIRVTRGKRVAFLWRGSVERWQALPVDVFYSGQGEVVRVQNGRIVGALGLTTEWRRVNIVSPTWAAIARAPAEARVIRTRDVMPGYFSGVREELALRSIRPPAGLALSGVRAEALAWFEERATTRPPPGVQRLPPTRYAVDLAQGEGVVVYAEQCLATDLCFAWQRWSAAMQQASAH